MNPASSAAQTRSADDVQGTYTVNLCVHVPPGGNQGKTQENLEGPSFTLTWVALGFPQRSQSSWLGSRKAGLSAASVTQSLIKLKMDGWMIWLDVHENSRACSLSPFEHLCRFLPLHVSLSLGRNKREKLTFEVIHHKQFT